MLLRGKKDLIHHLRFETGGFSFEKKVDALLRFKLERLLSIGIADLTGSFNLFRVLVN